MTAADVINLLAQKHSEDVFVPECKTGESSTGYSRMDAWVMKKSWSNPLVVAYEVKVDRQDFLRDDKWRKYLDYCNQFYFVAPKGIIQPEELPADVGLMWVTGTRLFTKRKAPYRDVVVPEDLYRYILMARAKITRDAGTAPDKSDRRVMGIKDYLEGRATKYYLGHMLGIKLAEAQVDLEKNQALLESQLSEMADIRTLLEEFGYTPPYDRWSFERAARDIRRAVQGNVDPLRNSVQEMKRYISAMERVLDTSFSVSSETP